MPAHCCQVTRTSGSESETASESVTPGGSVPVTRSPSRRRLGRPFKTVTLQQAEARGLGGPWPGRQPETRAGTQSAGPGQTVAAAETSPWPPRHPTRISDDPGDHDSDDDWTVAQPTTPGPVSATPPAAGTSPGGPGPASRARRPGATRASPSGPWAGHG